jgi:hypothetical protein
VIDEILDLPHDEMLDFPLYRESAPTGETILDAVEIGRSFSAGPGVILETNLFPGLPVLAMEQSAVSIKFLKNARHFPSDGHGRAASCAEESRVAMPVKDTGRASPWKSRPQSLTSFTGGSVSLAQTTGGRVGSGNL